MIALVKTHASIGKSILTVEKAFELPQDEVILVEDSMAGFRSAKKLSEKTGKPLRFGLRLETGIGRSRFHRDMLPGELLCEQRLHPVP